MDMDKVQISVCSCDAFGMHAVDSFMPLCVMPWPRRKCGCLNSVVSHPDCLG